MRGLATVLGVVVVLAALVLSSMSTGHASSGSPGSGAAVPSAGTSAPTAALHPRLSDPAAPAAPTSSVSAAFDQRVRETAAALAAAGVPAQRIRLPYVGTPAQVVNGAVVPGYEVALERQSVNISSVPAPMGVAYYGVNQSGALPSETVLNASSVAGALTVNQLDALYLDVDTPDMWGIQLNAVLGVTLHGISGYEYWVQNAVDVFQHNDTISLGEDTWNFSNASASIPNDTSTILSHGPNGSVTGGVYIGEGPWLAAPEPFNLTLYLNSSVTASYDQELWYNYSLQAAGGVHEHGNYDWVVFNSGGSPSLPIAPFVADGTQLDPVGLPNDYELDYGIGGYNGADMDVLAANTSATLDYCPITVASCTPGQFRSVPAAESFGGETGETGSGLYVSYNGTTAYGTGGPGILRGLWGFHSTSSGSGPASAAGSTAVSNAITVSGSPDPTSSPPYVFVFLMNPLDQFDNQLEWAPDVPVWHLAPASYDYEVMLADHTEEVGALVVGSTSTSLAVNLPYNASTGVYTPLWALSDAQLAGISTSGTGTISSQYALFNNPTVKCTHCGLATPGKLSPAFFSLNDYLFPTFAGVLLVGTDAYVDLNAPPTFEAYAFPYGLISSIMPWLAFYLQIQFVSTEHVTLAHDAWVGGWPAMYETGTLAGLVDGSVNPFPQANVIIWGSSDDLVMANDLVSTPTVPEPGTACIGLCIPILCYGCISPDGLLLYGGTNNTVWGNTFRDGSPAFTTYDRYAGLAEAESGDLIYNNNFSTDNPTVYLPFDIYTDACPDGYAGQCGPLVPPVYNDTWNVSAQPSSSVSATVDGFPLSGNVLGPTCPTQGGNYWDDYGNKLNPSGAPFTNVYNYSEILSLLPGGSSPDQKSIRVGADYLPLTEAACRVGPSYEVHFHATGLPQLPIGTQWSVQLPGGELLTSTYAWVNGTVAPGSLEFTVNPPSGFGVARVTGLGEPTYTSANISGNTTLSVQFGALELLNFLEVTSSAWPGLPSSTSWAVTLTSTGHGGPPAQTMSTTGSSVSFSVAKGTALRFTVTKPSTYTVSGGKGSVTVPSHAVTKDVKFRPETATIKFVEHGLVSGTSWTVTVTPTSPAGAPIVLSGTGTLKVALTNGTYTYTVAVAAGESPTPASGTLTVSAPHSQKVSISFG